LPSIIVLFLYPVGIAKIITLFPYLTRKKRGFFKRLSTKYDQDALLLNLSIKA